MCAVGCMNEEGVGVPKTLGALLIMLCGPNAGLRTRCRI